MSAHLGDARLARVINNEPLRCATVNEYSQATGMDAFSIIQALSSEGNQEHIRVEAVGGELFVRTGGHLPANLWATLTQDRSDDEAARVWEMLRTLERNGWSCEVRGNVLAESFPTGERVDLAIKTASALIPIAAYPRDLNAVDPLARTGTAGIAVLIPAGTLDEYITAGREWYFNHPHVRANLILMESPAFTPVVIEAGDASVAPRWVTVEELHNL